MELKWQVNGQKGSQEIVPGKNMVKVTLNPGGTLSQVKASLDIPPAPKMFFNGFQSWTYSPEFTTEHRIRGAHGLLRPLSKMLALDHFADYHFIPYPHRKGILHGFSYCYFRENEHYTLIASLDERPGYTVFTYDCDTGILSIERDCKGVSVQEEDFSAFDLFYAQGSEEEVFDGWFDCMGIHNDPPKIKGYSSWYNRYQRINERNILDDLAGAKKLFTEGDLFQIDDGWEKHVGDWEAADPGKFPNGLSPIADKIHAAGFKAGLWLAPFVCEKKSHIFRDHPDWLLRYKNSFWKNGPNWGGSYSLDIDNPEVQTYLRNVFSRVFEDWGFDLVKLDFLYAAAPHHTGDHDDENDVPFSESRAARMTRALEFLRDCCRDKLILGCGVPLMPAFGLADYCRVGSDMSLDWDDKFFMHILHRERVSTYHSIRNTIFRRQLDGRAFGIDPDVFFLRDRNLSLTEKERIYLASVNALLGSVWLTSDDLNLYDKEKTDLYKQLSKLSGAGDIHVDPETMTVRFKLDGIGRSVSYPRRHIAK